LEDGCEGETAAIRASGEGAYLEWMETQIRAAAEN